MSINAETVGYAVGRIWTSVQQLLRSGRAVFRLIVLILVLIFATPPLTQYWLNRVHLPDVPISAIVAMAVGSLLLLAFGAVMYVALHFLRQIVLVERTVVQSPASIRRPVPAPTEGTFIPASDSQMWARETIDDLAKQGILMKTDVGFDVEELANDIVKGRTTVRPQ